MSFHYAHHRPLTPITPIHSPHPSAGSSVRTRTPGQLSLHEYRKMQVTPSPPAVPGQKTVKKKHGVTNLGRTESLSTKSPTPSTFPSFVSVSTPPATPSLEPGLNFTLSFSPPNVRNDSRLDQATVGATYPEFAHLRSFDLHSQHSPPTSPSLPTLSSASRPLLSTSPHQPSTPKHHDHPIFSPERPQLKGTPSISSRSFGLNHSDLHKQSRYVGNSHREFKHNETRPGSGRPPSAKLSRARPFRTRTPPTAHRSAPKDHLESHYSGPLIKDRSPLLSQDLKHQTSFPAPDLVSLQSVDTTAIKTGRPNSYHQSLDSGTFEGLGQSPAVVRPRERHFKPIKHLPQPENFFEKRPVTLKFSPIPSDPLNQSDITASTSTFSLSKFPFPKPPAYDQLRYSAPIASPGQDSNKLILPAKPVLRHSDTFFELINPHESLPLSNIFEPPEEDSDSGSDSDFELLQLPSDALLGEDDDNMNPFRRLKGSSAKELRRHEHKRSVSSPPPAQLYPDAQTARDSILSSSQKHVASHTQAPTNPTTPITLGARYETPRTISKSWTFNENGQRVSKDDELITSAVDAEPQTHISAVLAPTSPGSSRSLPEMFEPLERSHGYNPRLAVRGRAMTTTSYAERRMTPILPEFLLLSRYNQESPFSSAEILPKPWLQSDEQHIPTSSLSGPLDAPTSVLFRPRGEGARFRSAPSFHALPSGPTGMSDDDGLLTGVATRSGNETGLLLSGNLPEQSQMSRLGMVTNHEVEGPVISRPRGAQWPLQGPVQMPTQTCQPPTQFMSWTTANESPYHTVHQPSAHRATAITRDTIPSYYEDDFESRSVSGTAVRDPPGRAQCDTRYSIASSAFQRTPSFLRYSEPFPFDHVESHAEPTSTISRIIDDYGDGAQLHNNHPLHSNPASVREDVTGNAIAEKPSAAPMGKDKDYNKIAVRDLNSREDLKEALWYMEINVPLLSRGNEWYTDRYHKLQDKLRRQHGNAALVELETELKDSGRGRRNSARESTSDSSEECDIARRTQLLHLEAMERDARRAREAHQLQDVHSEPPAEWLAQRRLYHPTSTEPRLRDNDLERSDLPAQLYEDYSSYSETDSDDSVEQAAAPEPFSLLSRCSPPSSCNHAPAQSGPAPTDAPPSPPDYTGALIGDRQPQLSNRANVNESSEVQSYDDTRKLLGIGSNSFMLPDGAVPTAGGGYYWPNCQTFGREVSSDIPRLWNNHSPGLRDNLDTPSQDTEDIAQAIDDEREWETEPSASQHNSGVNPYAQYALQNPCGQGSAYIRDNTYDYHYMDSSPSWSRTPPSTTPFPTTPRDLTDDPTYPGFVPNDMLSTEPHDGFEDDSAVPETTTGHEITAEPATAIASAPQPPPTATASTGTRFAQVDDDIEMGDMSSSQRRSRSFRASVPGQTSMHQLILPRNSRSFVGVPRLTRGRDYIVENTRERLIVSFCRWFFFLPFFNLLMGYGVFDWYVGRQMQWKHKRMGLYLGWGVFFVVSIVATGVAASLLT